MQRESHSGESHQPSWGKSSMPSTECQTNYSKNAIVLVLRNSTHSLYMYIFNDDLLFMSLSNVSIMTSEIFATLST